MSSALELPPGFDLNNLIRGKFRPRRITWYHVETPENAPNVDDPDASFFVQVLVSRYSGNENLVQIAVESSTGRYFVRAYDDLNEMWADWRETTNTEESSGPKKACPSLFGTSTSLLSENVWSGPPVLISTSLSNGTPQANVAFLHPLIVSGDCLVQDIGVNCLTPQPGQHVKLAIYDSDVNGLPENIILDTVGAVELTAAGMNTLSPEGDLELPPGVYWALSVYEYFTNSQAVVTMMSSSQIRDTYLAQGNNLYGYRGYKLPIGYSDPLPAEIEVADLAVQRFSHSPAVFWKF